MRRSSKPLAWKDFQGKEREGTQIKGNTGGRFAGNESTFQSRNKPGNIARISRGGQVRRVTRGRSKTGERARDGEGEGRSNVDDNDVPILLVF